MIHGPFYGFGIVGADLYISERLNNRLNWNGRLDGLGGIGQLDTVHQADKVVAGRPPAARLTHQCVISILKFTFASPKASVCLYCEESTGMVINSGHTVQYLSRSRIVHGSCVPVVDLTVIPQQVAVGIAQVQYVTATCHSGHPVHEFGGCVVIAVIIEAPVVYFIGVGYIDDFPISRNMDFPDILRHKVETVDIVVVSPTGTLIGTHTYGGLMGAFHRAGDFFPEIKLSVVCNGSDREGAATYTTYIIQVFLGRCCGKAIPCISHMCDI